MNDNAETFAERLRAMAQGSATIDIAQFQFVGLNEVELAYGDRWPEQKVRVFDIAHEYLAKRLGPADVLLKGGGGFIIVSGSASGQEAQVMAASLAHGLSDHFLGEIREAPSPRVGVQSLSVDVQGLLGALGAVPFVAADTGTTDQQSSMLSGMDWRFQPVWDVRREALGSYYLVPFLRDTQSRIPGYQFESTLGPPKSFVEIDEASLWVAEQALQDLFEKEGRALVGVAVHSSSLTNLAARAKLFKAMERFDKRLLRYKTIKIASVVPGFPRMYLNEIVSSLKQRIPNIVISAAWDEPDLAGLLESDPIAIGFALPASVLGAHSLVEASQLLSRVRNAASVAHAARKLFFVEGAITRELAMRFSAMGVDNISSPRIWPTCSAPESVVKWSADRLMTA